MAPKRKAAAAATSKAKKAKEEPAPATDLPAGAIVIEACKS
jgi:hypothetical protein